MGRVLGFLLIFGLIYYFFRAINRFIWGATRRQSSSNYNYNQQQKREGDVTINNNPQKKKHFSKDEGDYVDFEEVK